MKYPELPNKRTEPEKFEALTQKLDDTRHGVRQTATTHITIDWYDKFNPGWWFGNIDDPKPPEWYRAQECPFVRKFMWGCRNPLHNFHFYVLGLADKDIVLIGKYPELIGKPGGGWNFTVVAYKHLRLPFVSYTRGRFNFYFGWRNHGNFGIKLNREKRRANDKKQAEPATPTTPRHNERPGIFYRNKKAVREGPPRTQMDLY